MRILLTGSSGFLGRALVAQLDACAIPYDKVIRRSDFPDSDIRKHPDGWEISWPNGLSKIDFSQYTHVVHLALAKPRHTESLRTKLQTHIEPVQAILDGCAKTGTKPHIIFISSQSAWNSSSSAYGQGKFLVEELLQKSEVPFSIVKPGLIVDEDAGGLFGSLVKALRHLPVLGVPVSPKTNVQVVARADVVEVLYELMIRPSSQVPRVIEVGQPEESLLSFVRKLRISESSRALVIGVPFRIFVSSIGLIEKLLPTFPFSAAQLRDLTECPVLDPVEAVRFLGRPLTDCFEVTDRLAREAQFIHRKLFHGRPSAEALEHYRKAHEVLKIPRTELLEKIIDKNLDMEAIEFVLRKKNRILTQKILLMCYFAELDPVSVRYFIAEKNNWFGGGCALVFHVLRTIYKFFVGKYLVFRYGLV